jgi:PAS domain S-box-containing protein
MIRVLYVDDEADLLTLGKAFLEMSGEITVDTLDSAEAAQERLSAVRYDAVISDYQMPEVNGIEFLKRLRSQGSSIPFILFTGRGREEVVIQALNAGATFYLQKGGKVEAQFVELEHKLKEAVKRREAEQELARLNRELLAIKEISGAIIHAETEVQLLEETCHIACEVGGYILAWVGYMQNDEARSISPVAWSGRDEAYVRDVRASWADCERGEGPTGTAARTGRAAFMQDWSDDSKIVCWRDRGRANGYRSSISLPINLAQGTIGVLSLYSGVVNGFTRNEVQMLEEMVSELAYGISNLRAQAEKSRAEEAMRESEEKFYTAFHGSVAAMCLLRARDGTILDVNDRYARVNGYTRPEMIGRGIAELGLWGELRQPSDLVSDFQAEGQILDHELTLLRRDGTPWTMLFSAKLVSLRGEEVILVSQIDITARKRAEETLELEQRKIATGMDLANMACWEYDALADQYTFDDRFYALFGTSAAAEGGPHMSFKQYLEAFAHPDDKARILREVRAQVDAGFPTGQSHHEHRIVRRDGQVRVMLVRTEVVRDPSGKVVKSVGVNQDITELKLTQEKLGESEREFRTFVQESAEGISLTDEEGRLIEWNRSLEAITGVARSDAIGRHYWDVSWSIMADEAKQFVTQETWRQQASAQLNLDRDDFRSIKMVNRIKRPDGEARTIEQTVFLLSPGPKRRFGGIVRDVTEEKLAEQRLCESEEKYRVIFNNELYAICIFDLGTQRFLDANEAFVRLYGHSREDLLSGMTIHDITVQHQESDRATARATREGTVFIPLRYHRRKDGTVIPVEIVGGPYIWQGRQVMFGIFHEISDRLHAETALKLANKKLSLLSSITRHDMSNSLVIMRGNVELLRLDHPGLATDKRMAALDVHAQRLQGIVSFAKNYESMGISEPAWHDLRSMVSEAASGMAWGDVRLVNEVPPGVQVLVDPLAVRVFSNLMDNSLRHGRSASEVRVSCAEGEGSLSVTCQDDGVGVPAAEKESIFQLGYGRNTGLGLFLSREVLDLTGMTIVENGEAGKGARFEMRVPAGSYRADRGPGAL